MTDEPKPMTLSQFMDAHPRLVMFWIKAMIAYSKIGGRLKRIFGDSVEADQHSVLIAITVPGSI